MRPFHDLPNDTLSEVFRFLNSYEILNSISLVNKNFNFVSNQQWLWKSFVKTIGFMEEDLIAFSGEKTIDEISTFSKWKEFHRFLLQKKAQKLLNRWQCEVFTSKEDLVGKINWIISSGINKKGHFCLTKETDNLFSSFKKRYLFPEVNYNQSTLFFVLKMYKNKKKFEKKFNKPEKILQFSENDDIHYFFQDFSHLRIEKIKKTNNNTSKQKKESIEIIFNPPRSGVRIFFESVIVCLELIGGKFIDTIKLSKRKTKSKPSKTCQLIENWTQNQFIDWCDQVGTDIQEYIKPLLQKNFKKTISLDNYPEFLKFSEYQNNGTVFNAFFKFRQLRKQKYFDRNEWTVTEKLKRIGFFTSNHSGILDVLIKPARIAQTFLRFNKIYRTHDERKRTKEIFFQYKSFPKEKVNVKMVLLNYSAKSRSFLPYKSLFPFQKQENFHPKDEKNPKIVAGLVVEDKLFVWNEEELIIPQIIPYRLSHFIEGEKLMVSRINFFDSLALTISKYNCSYSYQKLKTEQSSETMKNSFDFVKDAIREAFSEKLLSGVEPIEKMVNEAEENGKLCFYPNNSFKDFFEENLLKNTFKLILNLMNSVQN